MKVSMYQQLAFNQTERNLLKLLKSTEIFKYLLIGIIEVEANFMVVKAYSYTSVTSVQILDCFSIAAVLLLSRLWLHTLYRWCHYLGVTISVVGLGALVAADVITGKNKDEGSDIALGDSLVIIGAILYGFNNVAQEYVVKNYNKSEYLGMVGLFSTVVSGIQVIILEREELSNINFVSYKVVSFGEWSGISCSKSLPVSFGEWSGISCSKSQPSMFLIRFKE
nr:solute carrier family 35 member F2-like [Biomphalaria glabrata]